MKLLFRCLVIFMFSVGIYLIPFYSFALEDSKLPTFDQADMPDFEEDEGMASDLESDEKDDSYDLPDPEGEPGDSGDMGIDDRPEPNEDLGGGF